jgi:hypothetical protein
VESELPVPKPEIDDGDDDHIEQVEDNSPNRMTTAIGASISLPGFSGSLGAPGSIPMGMPVMDVGKMGMRVR